MKFTASDESLHVAEGAVPETDPGDPAESSWAWVEKQRNTDNLSLPLKSAVIYKYKYITSPLNQFISGLHAKAAVEWNNFFKQCATNTNI